MSASQGKGARGYHGSLAWRRRSRCWRLGAVVVSLLSLVACARSQSAAGPASPVAPTSPTPRATALPPARVTRQAPAASPTPTSLTLTIWGPDFMAPLDEAPGGSLLASQIRAFTDAHPHWQVEYVRKRPRGQGGLVSFLQSTQGVAPQLLPDLVLIDMSEVGLLADSSLLQPLDTLLGSDLTADLVPFAHQAGRVGQHLLAVQYEADIRFLAYNSALIAQPPATWAELAAGRLIYLLPIGSSPGAVRDAFLPQYFALGGKLADREGRPYLDQTVVAAILEVYYAARQAELLPASGLDLEDASDCWPIYLATSATTAGPRPVAMTNATSWDYGRDRARLAQTRVAPLPTLSGALISLSDGWGWGLVTRDPTRQAAARDLLHWLLRPEAMAAWSEVTFHLPTRRSALPLAIKDEEYLRFLQRVMEATVPQPREPLYTLAVEALQPAIDGVCRGLTSPAAAAAAAAQKMRDAQPPAGSNIQQ